MDRPERIKLIITPKTIKELNENIGNLNYNRAIDDMEAYHKQVLTELADEGKIHKIVDVATDEYINNLNKDDGVNIYIAKAISAMIKEKI